MGRTDKNLCVCVSVCVLYWVLKRPSNLYPFSKGKQWAHTQNDTHTHSTLPLLLASPHCGSSTIPRNCPPSHSHTHTLTLTHRFLSAVCLNESSTFYTCVHMCLPFLSVKCSGTMVGCSECGMAWCVFVVCGHTQTHSVNPTLTGECSPHTSTRFQFRNLKQTRKYNVLQFLKWPVEAGCKRERLLIRCHGKKSMFFKRFD